MSTKISVSKFVEFLNNRVLAKDGYIMGATGQNPKKWATTSWWYTQYSGSQKEKALFWRENAKRVWDCNGLAEGYYKDVTGIDINTKARFNYANWCSVKGTGKVPNKHKVPGLAVFMGKTAAKISHVGYLVAPVDASNPGGDWYVVEARGVMYGVVKTKYSSRNWNYWGYMDKYFDYTSHDIGTESENVTALGCRTLRKGDIGADVTELQQTLMKAGYDLGTHKDDGEFGLDTLNAVMKFQTDHKITVDGVVGKQTYAVIDTLKETKFKVVVTGETVYVRSAGNKSGEILKVAKKGETYEGIGTQNGWHEIKLEKCVGWISGKYSEVEEFEEV